MARLYHSEKFPEGLLSAVEENINREFDTIEEEAKAILNDESSGSLLAWDRS